MRKVYYVTIKGRTLESRNLKELLARAVTVKRNSATAGSAGLRPAQLLARTASSGLSRF